MTLYSQGLSSNIKYYKNSEALEKGLTEKRYKMDYCQFCGKKLEIIGLVMTNTPFEKHWISQNRYEKCDCKDAQNYWGEVDKREKKQLEKQKEWEYQQKLDQLIKNSNLGERYRTRTFENYQVNEFNKKAYETCLRYANKFNEIKKEGSGIFLLGSCGVGKTHLAAAITHELIKQDHRPIFGTLINLLDRIRSTYNNSKSEDKEAKILNSYYTSSLLIIDDLGKEKLTEWSLQRLYEILNTRYENKMPVIITSNYTIEKLREKLTVNDNYETAESIISRIYEMCQGLKVGGDDYRKLH